MPTVSDRQGWGDMDTPVNAEAILTREREKTWELMRELVDDMSVFDVLTYSNLFHNLKAAIKEVATEEKNPNISSMTARSAEKK